MARSTFRAGYAVDDVAKLLGVSPAQVQAWVRAGFVARSPGREPSRFSLQDIVLLRTAKELSTQVGPRKVKEALQRLRAQLPKGRSLSGVRITAEGDDIVVRDGQSVWEPASGQGLLHFEVREIANKIAPLARKAAQAARASGAEPGPEDWYDIGCDLESSDPEQARDAYRRALELDPTHVGARVNLGRLLHENGFTHAAEAHYRLALLSHAGHATAAFNLGVALEDQDRLEEAVQAYGQALASDPGNADAHYNIARLYERLGRKAAAIRHLKDYRILVGGSSR